MCKIKSDCLLDMDKEFMCDVNTIIREKWDAIVKDFIEAGHIIYMMEVGIDKEVSQEFYKKHFPNLDMSDFGIYFKVVNNRVGDGLDIEINYTYKGLDIRAIDYYVLPKDYIEVPIKMIIEEVVSQETHKPNMLKDSVQNKLKELAKQKLSE